MKKLLLLSGGMDSTLVLYRLVGEFGSENVIALTINFDQLNQNEIKLSSDLCTILDVEHIVFDFKDFGNQIRHTFKFVNNSTSHSRLCLIPHKNLVFSGIASSIAEVNECDSVYIGCTKEDLMVWDVSEEYFETLSTLTNNIEFKIPLINMVKSDIFKELSLYINPDVHTDSCYAGSKCGECGSCCSYEKAKNNESI